MFAEANSAQFISFNSFKIVGGEVAEDQAEVEGEMFPDHCNNFALNLVL